MNPKANSIEFNKKYAYKYDKTIRNFVLYKPKSTKVHVQEKESNVINVDFKRKVRL